MTPRREFQCRPCKRGECEDCVRLIWDGEGCVHECYNGRQLGLFPLSDQGILGRGVELVEHQAPEEVDW